MAGVYLGPYVPPHAHARQFTELLASPGTPIDPTANYTAAIVLKLKAGGEDALKNAVARTSDPQHADYGKFLTRTEVVALTAPPSDYVEAVQHWLEHGDCQGHGPQSTKIRATLSKGGDVIWVSGQIKDVESRFGTRLALFDHGERKAVRASMPLSAVPYCASQHMSFVTMNTPIQPGRARRGAKVSKSEKVDIEGTATLLTRSGKVHVKQACPPATTVKSSPPPPPTHPTHTAKFARPRPTPAPVPCPLLTAAPLRNSCRGRACSSASGRTASRTSTTEGCRVRATPSGCASCRHPLLPSWSRRRLGSAWTASLIRCPTFTLNRPALALIIAQLLGPHHRAALALITAAYPAPTPCAQVSFSQLEKRKRSRLHSFQWDNHSSSLSLSDVLLLLIDRRGSGKHH